MKRLLLGDEGASKSLKFDHEKYRQNILEHLIKLFNIRQGSCMANPQLGLPDLNDLDMHMGHTAAVAEYKKAIKENIERYEKSIKKPRVRFIKTDSPFQVSFLITGKIEIDGKLETVKFETKKSDTGQLEVL